MIRKFIAAFLIIFFAASTTAFAADETKIIRVMGNGQAPSNWDQRDSFAKTFARQTARMDALRTLAEVLDDGKSKLSQDSEVFKLLGKNARQVGYAKFYADATCEVIMEVVVPASWKI